MSAAGAKRSGVRRAARVAVAVSMTVTAASAVACSSADDEGDAPSLSLEPIGDREEVVVAAASSLSGAFEAMEPEFETLHPDIDLVFTFDSSATLATQIEAGAPVAVFAAAGTPPMDQLDDAGALQGEPEPFARNGLVIVVPHGNPKGVESLDDLVSLDVVALCAEDAPCGQYAAEALRLGDAVIDDGQVTRAPNATATVSAVADGDADAAIVYATDALGQADLDTVVFPEASDVVATYPVAIVADAPPGASEFVAYLLGTEGQGTLEQYGFLRPP